MTVPATTRRAGPYSGNGVTTSFPFSFKVFDKTDVAVILTGSDGTSSTLVLDSNYGVTLNADQDANPGGSITYPILVGPSPLPIGSTLTMIGGLQAVQGTDLTSGGRFLPQVVENALDKLTILIQQLQEVSSRTLQAAVGTTVSLFFPAPSSGKFIRWRTDLLGLENADAGTDSMALQGLLADAADLTHGTAMIGYKVDGIGATGRTLASKLMERVSVKDFGALGNDSANDTAAIQLAIDHCAATGKELYVPPGSYRFTTLTLSAGITMRGAGRTASILKTTSATANALLCTGTTGYEFSDLQFAASVTRTAGDFVKILPASSYNGGTIFRRCSFPLAWNAIEFAAANAWAVENCLFQGHQANAIIVANTAVPDAGDSSITGCVFDSNVATAAHINQLSSGGLRVINNKFLGAGYHYIGQFNSGASPTSILILEANSFESATTANIALNSTNNTSFSKVVIRNNQLSVIANATGIALQDPGYVWLDDVSIGGNNIAMGGAGGVAISVARCNRLTLGTNQIVGNNLETGLIIGANVTNAVIAPQDITSLATPWSGAGITAATFSPGRKENGGVVASTSVAYGSLFATALQPVTFVQPFAKEPVITTSIQDAGDAVSALVSSITVSGFQVRIVGMTNGQPVQVNWEATG